MAQNKAPNISIQERYVRNVVNNTHVGRSGLAGPFTWGPVGAMVSVDLVTFPETFGRPNDFNYNFFMNGENFLSVGGNDLRVVRAINKEHARNATALFDGLDIDISVEGTNYSVGDKILVKQNGRVVEESGEVTEVDADGKIKRIFVPSEKVIARLKLNGIYPEIGTGWVVEIDNASAGIGATFKFNGLVKDSGMILTRPDFADAEINNTDFAEACKKFNLPKITALYPGELGNSIRVHIISYQDYTATERKDLTVYPYGNKVADSSREELRYGPVNEHQYGIIVYVGTEAKEWHVVSTKPNDLNHLNKNIYVDNYFQLGNSEYIFATARDWVKGFSGVLSLGGGDSAMDKLTAGDLMEAWDHFRHEDNIFFNSLIAGSVASSDPEMASVVQKYVSSISDLRQDSVAIISPLINDVVGIPKERAVTNIVKWRGSELEHNFNVDSTYSYIIGDYKYQYDRYNNIPRWVSLSGDVAGLMAKVDRNVNESQSPAGSTHGVIENAIKIAINPNDRLRSRLTTVAVNPVSSFGEGSGFMIWADLTATLKPTPFDHINIRRVFNKIKYDIKTYSLDVMFKNNTIDTRRTYTYAVNGYLRELMGNTIEWGKVVCDESNNTLTTIARNEFIADIYIKPYHSINYVKLSFVAVESELDVEFEIVNASDIPQ